MNGSHFIVFLEWILKTPGTSIMFLSMKREPILRSSYSFINSSASSPINRRTLPFASFSNIDSNNWFSLRNSTKHDDKRISSANSCSARSRSFISSNWSTSIWAMSSLWTMDMVKFLNSRVSIRYEVYTCWPPSRNVVPLSRCTCNCNILDLAKLQQRTSGKV